MTAANFARAMPKILAYEGGYSNHPRDPGGVTLEGIIQRVYDGYRDRKGLSRRDLHPGMQRTAEWQRERDEIYRMQYWDAVHGDELPSGVDFVVFDGAVNSGPSQSIKWLQRALKMSNVDGSMGNATLAAVKAHPDYVALIADICARRMAFLRQLKTFDAFGHGWTSRVVNVQATGQAWVSSKVGPKSVEAHRKGGDAKALERDVADAPISVGQTATTTTATTIGYGTVDQLQQATAAIEPLANTLTVAKWILLGISVLSAGLLLYGVWRSFKAQRARNGEDVAVVPEDV